MSRYPTPSPALVLAREGYGACYQRHLTATECAVYQRLVHEVSWTATPEPISAARWGQVELHGSVVAGLRRSDWAAAVASLVAKGWLVKRADGSHEVTVPSTLPVLPRPVEAP